MVRDAYRRCAVYHFVWKLERAARQLPAPARARASGDGGVVESIVAAGPKTYQGKASNVAQIESLLGCVQRLLGRVDARRLTVLDLGAGKALLTRAVYEASGRRVAVIALDRPSQSGRRERPSSVP